MKVVMIPGLEAALKALAEEGKIPLDADGKIPDGYIPAIIVRKDDLAGYLKTVPAPTTTTLGGYKLWSANSPANNDRTYGRICNDKSGYPRPYPAQVASGVHWAGVVNAYAEYNPNLSYAYGDVYNAAAVNAVIESLKERIAALEAKTTTE